MLTHREENIDTEKNFTSLFTAINEMARYDMPILYSCHPHSRKRLEESGFELDPRVIRHEPQGFHDYNCLQMNACAVASDSGTLPEERLFFTSIGYLIPAVCIRTSTERPEALDKGCFILSGIDTIGLLQAVDTAVEMVRDEKNGGAIEYFLRHRTFSLYRIIMNRSFWSCIREFSIRLILGFCPCIMRRPDFKTLVPAVNSERVSGLLFPEAGILPFWR